MLITSQGTVEKFSEGIGNGVSRPLSLTSLGSLRVTQVENRSTEAARSGSRFVGGCQVIASGIAPVAAIPTTTATLGLYNTDTAKSLVIDSLGYLLGSGTPAAGGSLLIALSNGPLLAANVPVALANYSSQAWGKNSNTTIARWGAAITIPSGSAWVQALSTAQIAAANAGQGDRPISLNGGLIVPPGYCLGIVILSGAGTTPLYTVSAVWDEVLLDLE